MPSTLTSTRSARVTQIRHLHDRRHRAERGAFVVEGPQAVREALGPGLVELIATADALERHPDIARVARDGGARLSEATDDVIAAMSETRQSQGILAVCRLVTRPLADVVRHAARGGADSADPQGRPAHPGAGMLVVLDRVSDPGNAGTILRSADAMGAGGIVFTEGSVDPHNGKCVRSTAGSIFHVPVAAGASASEVIDACRDAGLAIVLADAHASEDLDMQGDLLRRPLAWVFGSEAHGLAAEWEAAATAALRIPMPGATESLNLAAAATVCLYATSRARARARARA